MIGELLPSVDMEETRVLPIFSVKFHLVGRLTLLDGSYKSDEIVKTVKKTSELMSYLGEHSEETDCPRQTRLVMAKLRSD